MTRASEKHVIPKGRTGTPIGFEIDDESVVVKDTVDGGSLRIDAIGSEGFQPALTDRFVFPVDSAISCTAEKVRVYINTSVRVRNENGEDLGEVTDEPWKLSFGTHCLDLVAGMKTFVRFVETPLSVAYVENDQSDAIVEVTLPESAAVLIGARSLHNGPAQTITVPNHTQALMEAVSYLGSSIKEFSAERSWPSLRGHPPRITIGDSLSIPPSIQKPETGVRITVPPNLADIYRIAPLAFYLGATVEPGDTAALHLDTGYSEPFKKSDGSIEPAVDELLRRCLFLDTLVRIGGYYSLPRYEYDALGDDLPFYPPNLYDRSISEQLMEYLEVPYEQIEPYVPTWSMTATLRSRIDDAELLTHVCNVLGTVHVENEIPAKRSARIRAFDSEGIDGYSAGTIPPGGTALSIPAFEREFAYEHPTEETVSFGLILDDATQAQSVRAAIESETTLVEPEQVGIVKKPSEKAVATLLEANHDFVYCVPPVTEGSIECIDGHVSKDHGGSSPPAVWMSSEVGSEGRDRQSFEPDGFVSIDVADSVGVQELINILELLQYGYPVAVSIFLALGTDRVRFYGNSGRELVLVSNRSPAELVYICSESREVHRTSLRTSPTPNIPLGSVHRLLHQLPSKPTQQEYQLQGTVAPYPLPWSTERVKTLLCDTDLPCLFNDRLLLGYQSVSEAQIEQWAKEAIERRNNGTADPALFDSDSVDDPIE
ncbi:hypothetical protein [Halalkalirubrum salinum]|uniref:hypothetical protein n=1 Tax=Halalkalirubrum salinum TaxID=2563889 RepID=UPI0010FB0715|nr:hypothetical protein [Halalkalirubrum salinum]